MKEKNTVNLLLILAVIGLMISAYSIFIQASMTPVLYKKYLLPIACVEYNSSYFLAQQTNPDFCEGMLNLENNLDENGFKKECDQLQSEDKSMCLSIANFYGRRIDDCSGQAFKTSKSSVSNKEMESVCGRFNELLR